VLSTDGKQESRRRLAKSNGLGERRVRKKLYNVDVIQVDGELERCDVVLLPVDPTAQFVRLQPRLHH
jgi:ribosome-associated protein YbcJ (S4-like RNA binding protein)